MRLFLSRLLICSGLLLALDLMPGGRSTSAPVYAQPPRPTIQPTATRIVATPAPKPKDDSDDDEAEPPGRITGTVIDLTTGAPVPGVVVMVGDLRLVTDANGNYDRSGLPSGNYTVVLLLGEGQGTPAQDPIAVSLDPGATVVQHLAFRSLQPATATPDAPAATPAPPLSQLPRTGGPDGGTGAGLLLAALMLATGLLMRWRAHTASPTSPHDRV